jgi:hypothetical protein
MRIKSQIFITESNLFGNKNSPGLQTGVWTNPTNKWRNFKNHQTLCLSMRQTCIAPHRAIAFQSRVFIAAFLMFLRVPGLKPKAIGALSSGIELFFLNSKYN